MSVLGQWSVVSGRLRITILWFRPWTVPGRCSHSSKTAGPERIVAGWKEPRNDRSSRLKERRQWQLRKTMRRHKRFGISDMGFGILLAASIAVTGACNGGTNTAKDGVPPTTPTPAASPSPTASPAATGSPTASPKADPKEAPKASPTAKQKETPKTSPTANNVDVN